MVDWRVKTLQPCREIILINDAIFVACSDRFFAIRWLWIKCFALFVHIKNCICLITLYHLGYRQLACLKNLRIMMGISLATLRIVNFKLGRLIYHTSKRILSSFLFLVALVDFVSIFKAKLILSSSNRLLSHNNTHAFPSHCLPGIVSWTNIELFSWVDLLGQSTLIFCAISVIKFNSELLQLLNFWHQIFIRHLLIKSS